MRKILGLMILACVALGTQGCLSVPVMPPPGLAFTDYRAPLDHEFDQTATGGKRGVAESMSILGLFATGDASAQAAARNGGIATINHADYEYFNVLGVYQRYRTVVYGN